MTQSLPVFTSTAGEAACMAAYQAVLDIWPVPYTSCMVPTSFGDTHVIASGRDDQPPLVLLHALFASAAAWYRNVEGLSTRYRVYAVDVIGEANKSRPSRTIRTQEELAGWFGELLDGLGIRQTDLAGNSYGAFMSAFYAMHMPERIRRLVLIGPASTFHPMLPFFVHMFIPKLACMLLPRLPGQQKIMRRSVEWMHAGIPGDGAWDELFYQLMLHGGMTTQVMPRVYKPEELGRIQADTLLLVGEREVIYPPERAMRAAKKLMPNLKVACIPDAHHIAALSQPDLVNREILDFLG